MCFLWAKNCIFLIIYANLCSGIRMTEMTGKYLAQALHIGHNTETSSQLLIISVIMWTITVVALQYAGFWKRICPVIGLYMHTVPLWRALVHTHPHPSGHYNRNPVLFTCSTHLLWIHSVPTLQPSKTTHYRFIMNSSICMLGDNLCIIDDLIRAERWTVINFIKYSSLTFVMNATQPMGGPRSSLLVTK
jgi:hypothetical protein